MMRASAVGQRVHISLAGSPIQSLSLEGALELVTEILQATDQARGYGEAIRGEVPDARAVTEAGRAAAAERSRRYRARKRAAADVEG